MSAARDTSIDLAARTRRPSRADLAALNESGGYGLSGVELDELVGLVDGALASHDRVAELASAERPAEPARDRGRRPEPDANPLGAWSWLVDLEGDGDGPLRGRTVAVKDSIAVAGLPLRNGTSLLDGFTPSIDATSVTRLLDAGARIVGKATCEALCLSGGSHTSDDGVVRNPHDLTRTSGGSSSGCAALVAAGEVDIALGTDQGGSVRGPASWCGVVGMKPSYGLVPYTGVFPVEMTIDHVGPLARTVDDVAAALAVLAGPDGLDPRQCGLPPEVLSGAAAPPAAEPRFGVLRDGFGWPELSDPRVDELVLAATSDLAAHGAAVVELELPWHRHGDDIWNVVATEGAWRLLLDGGAQGHNRRGSYWVELLEAFGGSVRRRPADLPVTAKFLALAGRFTVAEHGGGHYAMAQNLGRELARRYDELLASVDVLVLPTVPMVAPPLPHASASIGAQLTAALNMGVNTCPFNLTGHPALSVPCGAVDGMPVGAMLVGRRWEDSVVLAAGRVLESVVGSGAPPVRSQEILG